MLCIHITYLKFKLYGTDVIVELKLDRCLLHSYNQYALLETLNDKIIKKKFISMIFH